MVIANFLLSSENVTVGAARLLRPIEHVHSSLSWYWPVIISNSDAFVRFCFFGRGIDDRVLLDLTVL